MRMGGYYTDFILSGRQRGVQSRLNFLDIGPWPDINICQNQVRIFPILGATADQKATSNSVGHRPGVSDFGSLEANCLGSGSCTAALPVRSIWMEFQVKDSLNMHWSRV